MQLKTVADPFSSVINKEWKAAENKREAFKAEDKRMQEDGGPNPDKNYNKINSPGKKYNEQDSKPPAPAKKSEETASAQK